MAITNPLIRTALRGQRRVILILVMTVLGSLIVSCEKTPTAPQPLPPSPPPVPPAASLDRLEVSALATIAPGESVQLTATAVKSDGTTENVTTRTIWTSSNRTVIQVSSAGVAKAVAAGEATVFAAYFGKNAYTRTLVLPTGTFRLAGHVSESGFGLEHATVTVLSGVGEGLTVVTTSGGGYALYGVSGGIQVQAKKEGYVDRVQSLTVADHQTLDFEVTADRPRADLTGTYALTLAAAPCQYTDGSVPDAARSRAYTAQVVQNGPRLTVTLTGADFILTLGRGDHFSGFVEPNGQVTFSIGDVYYYYVIGGGQYDLVERFSDASVVIWQGIVTAQATSSGLSGGLAGFLGVGRGTTAPFASLSGYCYAGAHRFEMARR